MVEQGARRLPAKLQFSRDAGGGEAKVSSGWLAGISKTLYRKRLKQALLLAAIDIQLQRVRSLPVEKRPPQREALRRRRASILQGGIQAEAVSSHWEGIRKELLERHVIVMKGGWLQGNTRSFFLLTGADLMVFERLDSQPHKVQLSLLGSTARLEESHMHTANPPFETGFPARVGVTLATGGRLWLYAPRFDLAKHWYRTIRLVNQIHESKRGKLALEIPLETIANYMQTHSRRRAWDVLVSYNKIWWERHALLAQCSQAFASMTVLRGWHKMLEVYGARSKAAAEEDSGPGVVPQAQAVALTTDQYDAELLALREKAISWLQRRVRDLMRSDAGLSAAAKSAGRRPGPPLGHVRLQRCIPLGASFVTGIKQGGDGTSSQREGRGPRPFSASCSTQNLAPCNGLLWISKCWSKLHICQRGASDAPAFVHIDSIRSVIMHSERVDEFKEHAGPWLTVYGPLLNIHRGVSEMTVRELASSLRSPGSDSQSLRLTVAVRAGWIPKASKGSGTCTRAVLSLLGQRVVSAIQTGEDVDYTCALDRHIALPDDTEEASQFLDLLQEAVCSVDVIEEAHPDMLFSPGRANTRVLCGNRVALWRLLSTQSEMPTEKSPRSAGHRLLGFNSLTTSWRIPLSSRQEDQIGKKPFVDIDVRSEHVRSQSIASKPRVVSPEQCAAVASSPPFGCLGVAAPAGDMEQPEKLKPHFLQIRLGELKAGIMAKPEDVRIELRCAGLKVFSLPAGEPCLLEAKGFMSFNGEKLLLPLPPEVVDTSGQLPPVYLLVKCAKSKDVPQPMNFHDMLKLSGRAVQKHTPEVSILHAKLLLENLDFDDASHLRPLALCEVTESPHSSVLSQLKDTALPAHVPSLSVAACLRDDLPQINAEQGGRVYVGDAGTISVEEVLTYPRSEAEFRDRLADGRWDEQRIGVEGIPLRWPRTAVELAQSRLPPDTKTLVKLLRKPPVFEKWPRAEAVPPKFAVAADENECDFRRRQLPATWSRVQDLAQQEASAATPSSPSKPGPLRQKTLLVQELTHALREIVVTVLAVYNDGTCDVELSPAFVRNWKGCAHRRYRLPGAVLATPCTAIYEPDVESHRVVLQSLPVTSIKAEQSAGFHVYDAAVLKSQDAVAASLRGTAEVIGGPVPLDALEEVCRHEWKMHLRADSEEDMKRLVADLRQSVRMHQQARTAGGISLTATGQPVPKGSGQLEVLLVRAKNLMPRTGGCTEVANSLDALAAGRPILQVMGELLRPAKNLEIFVRLRILDDAEVLSMDGHQCFDSPTREGSASPSWSGLDHGGQHDGWVFRSQIFLPERMPNLWLELEVINIGIAGEELVGRVKVPITKKNFLTNVKAPFRNLWLPLALPLPDADGKWRVTECGDVQIMTMWKPIDSDNPQGQLSGASTSSSSSMSYLKAYLRGELEAAEGGARCIRTCGSDGEISGSDLALILEPAGYNPNLADCQGSAEEAALERAVSMAMLQPRLQCQEERSLHSWRAFRNKLKSAGLAKAPLAELRLYRAGVGEASWEEQLKALLRAGVPDKYRSQVWLDLSMAARSRAEWPEGSYNAFLDCGKQLVNASVQQLQQDSLTALDWEPSQDPAAVEAHRQLLQKARSVCLALIGFSSESAEEGAGIAYTESLLEIACHLLSGKKASLSEQDLFWLLHALAYSNSNGAFRDYFSSTAPGDGVNSALGMAEDTLLLDCALAIHEPLVRRRLVMLGIPTSALFWTYFGRLFAGVLPKASFWRLMDVLVGESADPEACPHGRHVLVDLSFGILQGARDGICACNSALEVTSLVRARLASLLDPEDLMDILVQAEAFLWQGFSRHEVLSMWSAASQEFTRFCRQRQRQDTVVRQLHALSPLKPLGESLDAAPRQLTTHLVIQSVVPTMQKALLLDTNCARAALRQLPEELLSIVLGPMVDPSAQDGKSVAQIASMVMSSALGLCGRPGAAAELPDVRPWNCLGSPAEPESLTSERFSAALTEHFPGWSEKAEELFAAFRWDAWASEAVFENHMSLNEFFLVLICCSQGSVTEKASAFFELFAGPARPDAVESYPHRIPISRVAELAGGPQEEEALAALGRVCGSLPPPRDSPALEIEVWANEYGELAGRAFVRSLWPFVRSSPLLQERELLRAGSAFYIWAEEGEGKTPRCVGELRLGISWTPRNKQYPAIGTLVLCAGGLKLFSAERLSRPWMRAVVYGEDGHRRFPVLRGHQSMGQKDGLLPKWAQDSFAASMTWTQEAARWNGDRQEWNWVSPANILSSTDDLKVSGGTVLPPQRPGSQKVVTLQSCRLISDVLLRRGCAYLSSRQVAQIADRCFHRDGICAALLEALLVEGQEVPSCGISREYCEEHGRGYVDVNTSILMELEKQIFECEGSLNLWETAFVTAGGASLQTLEMTDPFPECNKLLCLRYVRAGDGERLQITLKVGMDGQVSADQVLMDSSSYESLALSKKEFISCIQASPLLSEPLRCSALHAPATATEAQGADLVQDGFRRTRSPLMGSIVGLLGSVGKADALALDVLVADNTSSGSPSAKNRGLPLLFGDLLNQAGATKTPRLALETAMDGGGHGVKVFLNDTFRDFLAKVQEACSKLGRTLSSQRVVQVLESAKRYKSVSIGPEHQVFAFLPPVNHDPKDGLGALMGALADHASWFPLDKDLTFLDYVTAFSRYKSMPPFLRVVRAEEISSEGANEHSRPVTGPSRWRQSWRLHQHQDLSQEWR
ncbi:MKK3 [Symbiodinium sp. CCMP2456]|nr:MKK3 [Symbiodinium sp. CCMP2456]